MKTHRWVTPGEIIINRWDSEKLSDITRRRQALPEPEKSETEQWIAQKWAEFNEPT